MAYRDYNPPQKIPTDIKRRCATCPRVGPSYLMGRCEFCLALLCMKCMREHTCKEGRE